MTINDLGALGSFLAAIAVFITLIYLARQVRQGNILARYQARQAMMEQDQAGLQIQIEYPDIPMTFIRDNPSAEEVMKFHLFLTKNMREREWEWFQYRDGIIDREVYETYHEVIGIFLGIPKTQEWWKTIGHIGLNPEFVSEVNDLLKKRGMTNYWDRIKDYQQKLCE